MRGLVPLEFDRETSVRLATEALAARPIPPSDGEPIVSMLEADLREGRALGALLRDDERTLGIAVWEPPTSLGATLEVLYLVPAAQNAEGYRELLGGVSRLAGPVAFAPGGLSGLSTATEVDVMRPLGFAPFARSEMRLPTGLTLPVSAAEHDARVRSVLPTDADALAALHARAFAGRFDRYLFYTDPDPVRDAGLAIAEILGGRWGEFLGSASTLVETDRALLGATLVVRAPYGTLIADVMVDPGHRGRGVGRAALTSSLRALRAAGETTIVLNVTEGNRPARRLYEAVGFVRTLGPAYGWYSTARIPVAPTVD
jgi:ribosomal protein S18 acetylase RimI-like enzyme